MCIKNYYNVSSQFDTLKKDTLLFVLLPSGQLDSLRKPKPSRSFLAVRLGIGMAESKAVIGLKWEPNLSALPSQSSKSKSHKIDPQSAASAASLWKPNQQLVDGLFLPPNDPSKLKKLLKKQNAKDTAGSAWFDMPAPTLTPELKKDLQLLKVPFFFSLISFAAAKFGSFLAMLI